MNKFFYYKLAAGNIGKNSKFYLPYIIACTFSIAMFYIMYMLSTTGFFVHDNLKQMLSLGNGVIALFSVIFLFYTNSFLIKRRKMEFGLYSVLGMGKRHVAKVISLETVYTAFICLVSGLGIGILFSKLVYLILENIINFKLQASIVVSADAVIATLILFVGIFVLILLNSMRMIHLSKPIDLLKGGRVGEREPKTRWVVTILGTAALVTGYYMAVSIENPLDALVFFFLAVILVIIGTYCLFTSISVFVLKLLRKNKNYYYKTNHFISISGMMYRMKQNAVGLANICILATIVMVTISTTVSLYVGINDIMTQSYPKDISISTPYSGNNDAELSDAVRRQIGESKYTISNWDEQVYYSGMVTREGDKFKHEPSYQYETGSNQCMMTIIPLDDYNNCTGEDVDLLKNEAIIYTNKDPYNEKMLNLGGREFVIKGSGTLADKSNASKVLSSYGLYPTDVYILIVPEIDMVRGIVDDAREVFIAYGISHEEVEKMTNVMKITRFDVDATEAQQIKLASDLDRVANDVIQSDNEAKTELYVESRADNIQDFYSVFGGLLFIGLYLGVLFLLATVLIIYYKQLSEGYSDQERFRIMQNVGLTKKEVKKTIRSQVLTMFFFPLIVACVHICFAFPMISRMLHLFNLNNITLFIVCTLICAGVFAMFYAVIYALTSRMYYQIVESA